MYAYVRVSPGLEMNGLMYMISELRELGSRLWLDRRIRQRRMPLL